MRRLKRFVTTIISKDPNLSNNRLRFRRSKLRKFETQFR